MSDVKTLTLYLCAWNCRLDDKERDRSLPCIEPERCNCGAAEKNQLILRTRQAANDVSYHNAAEGEMWHREQDARREAVNRFNELVSRCEEMRIDWKQGESYLI